MPFSGVSAEPTGREPMIVPRKAIVLAAGFGTRLHPFTLDCPKALVPLKGKPLLAHTLERLAGWGVHEVAINVHTLADQVVEALPEITPKGVNIAVSFEPELLGTGGGLRRLEWFFDESPLWVCNADVVAELDPEPLLQAYEEKNPLSCLWMIRGKGPQTVECNGEGEVTDFRSRGLTFSGLHLMSPRLLNYLPNEERFGSVIPAYEKGMNEGERVLGVEVPESSWADIGTPDTLLEANGGSVVFPGAEVGPGIRLVRAVVGPGVKLRGRRSVSGRITSPARGLTAEQRKWFPDILYVELLAARGSDRTYKRIHTRTGSCILCEAGEGRPENFRVVHHTRVLRRKGVRVPEIQKVKAQGRVLCLEDVGRTELLERLKKGSVRRNRSDLRSVLRLVADLHRISPPDQLEPPFSKKLVAWEREYFLKEFLERFDPETDRDVLKKALSEVGRRLLTQPRVLIHRDLQSTNLMWYQGEPVLIDFQGMRSGPASYDLGSLLADPYVNRSRAEQEDLLALYNELADAPVEVKAYRSGTTQRLCQALGAFGKLGAAPQTSRFLQYIPAAVHQLALWADHPVLQQWATDFSERHDGLNPV